MMPWWFFSPGLLFFLMFLFWVNYRLTRSCKTFTERSPVYPSWCWIFQSKNWKFLPMATSYINIMFYQNQEIDINIIWLSRLQTSVSPVFECINFSILYVFVYNSVYRFIQRPQSRQNCSVITKDSCVLSLCNNTLLLRPWQALFFSLLLYLWHYEDVI